MSREIAEWLHSKTGIYVIVATVVVALGGTISLNLPYPKTEQVQASHGAIVSNLKRDDLVMQLKDNRNWTANYQSQIALLHHLEELQPEGLTRIQQEVLNSLEREMSLLIDSRESLMGTLEKGAYAHDPLHPAGR